MASEHKQRLKALRGNRSRQPQFNLDRANRHATLSRLPFGRQTHPYLLRLTILKIIQALDFIRYILSLLNKRPALRFASGKIPAIPAPAQRSVRGPPLILNHLKGRFNPLLRLMLLLLMASAIGFAVPALASDYEVRVEVVNASTQSPVDSALVRYVADDDTTTLVTDANGMASGSVTSVAGTENHVPAAYGLRVAPSLVEPGGVVRAEVSTPFKTDARVAVYDLLGREVTTRLDHIAAGIYFVDVVLGGRHYTQKIMARGAIRLQTRLTASIAAGRQQLASVSAVTAEVLVSKEGYEPLETTETLEHGVVNTFSYALDPITSYRVFGTAGNETAEKTLTKGTINFRGNNRVFKATINPDGTYTTTLPLSEETEVDIWLSNNEDYTTNTFAIVRKGMPTSIGRITSSVGVYEPDTAKVLIKDLYDQNGNYFLAFSDTSAQNQTILEGIRAFYGNKGVVPWILEDLTFFNFLLDYDTFVRIPDKRRAVQHNAIDFFYDKFDTPLGVYFANIDSTSGEDYPLPNAGYAFVMQVNSATAGNGRDPPGESYMTSNTSHTRHNDGSNKMITELAEANGINDDQTGHNGYAFTYDAADYITDLSNEGKVVWVVSHTYNSRDFTY